MTDLTPSFPSDSDLAVFREELASAAKRPDALGIDPALWPRFAGYYQGLTRLPRRLRRALQRRWRRSLGGLALLLALGQAPVLAGTINVDGVNCTLIDAITAANNNGFAGGCAAGSGADTIVLPPNSIHALTAVNNTTFGSNGLPVITSPITIDGNGSTIRREPSAPDFRILQIGSSGDLTLQETTVSGGRATGSFFDPQRGGGLLNNGRLSLVDSTVSANLALAEGGGVHNRYFVTLRLINSTISGNSASNGGGVSNSRGTVTMTNSTVSGNSASAEGGGVNSGGGPLTATNSTISGNFARGNGGGLHNTDALTLTTSTISGNMAGQDGGGLLNDSGTRALTLSETLISGNTASSRGPELANNGGAVNTDRSNLFGHDGLNGVEGFTPGVKDLVPGEPLAAILDTALRNNGGLAMTHALVAGSPAIDAGGNCAPRRTSAAYRAWTRTGTASATATSAPSRSR